jgi:hypothetical protein
MFPTIQTTYSPIRSLIDIQIGAITLSPDNSLLYGRLEFTMFAQDLTLPSDKEYCAIHGSKGGRVEFHDTDSNVNPGQACHVTKLIRGLAWNQYSLV